ncbi:hypothetical protein llh_7825 [Lactococcus cremoris subsp. cremoris A76]|uniref:Uncharacterized protein n=1 Tax=Lactococcus cremoris subsp. cremoris TIFN6 TaxID=1234876 RepID=T0TRA4_LACLC|nr:hypothetical protein llh_7825 [Lactococcus cremoris subsp. cremoris A76]EQC58218.1 hypothetical protein LLT6_10035 [Lactococcus cremoris subsp. cremoris TIFN6]
MNVTVGFIPTAVIKLAGLRIKGQLMTSPDVRLAKDFFESRAGG